MYAELVLRSGGSEAGMMDSYTSGIAARGLGEDGEFCYILIYGWSEGRREVVKSMRRRWKMYRTLRRW